MMRKGPGEGLRVRVRARVEMIDNNEGGASKLVGAAPGAVHVETRASAAAPAQTSVAPLAAFGDAGCASAACVVAACVLAACVVAACEPAERSMDAAFVVAAAVAAAAADAAEVSEAAAAAEAARASAAFQR